MHVARGQLEVNGHVLSTGDALMMGDEAVVEIKRRQQERFDLPRLSPDSLAFNRRLKRYLTAMLLKPWSRDDRNWIDRVDRHRIYVSRHTSIKWLIIESDIGTGNIRDHRAVWNMGNF